MQALDHMTLGLEMLVERIFRAREGLLGMLLQQAQAVPSRRNPLRKTARNCRAVVALAAMVLWMR